MKKVIALLLIALVACQKNEVIPAHETSFETYSIEEDPTVNPMRGLYQWRGDEMAPQSQPAYDNYERYYWKDMETAEGVYNFSPIINDMNAAIVEGRKFAFRIRMMGGYDDNIMYMPAWLYNHSGCASGCGWWVDVNPDNDGKCS